MTAYIVIGISAVMQLLLQISAQKPANWYAWCAVIAPALAVIVHGLQPAPKEEN